MTQETQEMYAKGQKTVEAADILCPHILYMTDNDTFEYTIEDINNILPENYAGEIVQANLIELLLDVEGKEFLTVSFISDNVHFNELLQDMNDCKTTQTSKRLNELQSMICICFQDDIYSVFDKNGNQEQFLYTDLGQHIENTLNFSANIKIKHVHRCVIQVLKGKLLFQSI